MGALGRRKRNAPYQRRQTTTKRWRLREDDEDRLRTFALPVGAGGSAAGSDLFLVDFLKIQLRDGPGDGQCGKSGPGMSPWECRGLADFGTNHPFGMPE